MMINKMNMTEETLDYSIIENPEVLKAFNTIIANSDSIRSKRHAYTVLKGHMKKKNINRGALTIDVKEDKDGYDVAVGKYEVKSAATSRIISDKDIADINIQDGYMVKNVKRFSFDTISITVDPSAQALFEIASTEIVIVLKKNGKVKLYAKSKKSIRDLETGKNVVCIDAKDGDKVLKYKSLAWTASNKRKLTVQGMLVNGADKDKRFNVLNDATSGGLKIFLDDVIDRIKNVSNKEELFKETLAIQKNYGYVGNCITGSKSFGKVEGFAIYHGKWTNHIDEMELDDKFVELKQELRNATDKLGVNVDEIQAKLEKLLSEKYEAETADGQAFGNATAISLAFEKETGVFIDPKYLAGMAVQCRPGNCKVMMTMVSQDTFKALMDGTTEMAARDNKKFEVVGSEKIEDIMFIVDRNGMKLLHDFNVGLNLEVLALAKESKSKASSQMLTTLLGVDKRRRETMGIKDDQTMKELVEELILETCEDRISQLFDTTKRPVTMAEYMAAKKTGYYTGLLNKAVPTWKLQSRGTFDTLVKQTTESVSNTFKKMNFEIEAHNRRLVPDPTFIITGGKVDGILNFGEVFINRMNVKNVCMIKYPKMGIFEYYTAKNISMKAIKARVSSLIKRNVITGVKGDAIIDFYKNLEAALAVLPASMLIAHCCAGLDFDWDGACFIEQTKKTENRVQEVTNIIMERVLSVDPLAVKF